MSPGESGPRLRVAIAGAGFASGLHVPGWQSLPDADVVAICDPVLDRAQARARAFGIDAVFDRVEAMLDQARPDVLDVAAPVAAHVPICLAAADRGVHVLCQKPLAPSLREARSLAQAIEGRIRLMVHENWRFRAHYRRIRQWLDERLIGDPVSCLMQVHASGLLADADGVRPQLVRQPSFAGIERLMIGEVLIHQLDVLRFLFGPLAMVAARAGRLCPAVAGEDHAVMLLEGRRFWAVVDGSFVAPGAPGTPVDRLEIVGTEGVVRLDGGTARIGGLHPRTEVFDLAAGYAASYAAAIAHFAQALRNGSAFETGIDDNLETLALVEDAYTIAGAAQVRR